MTDAERERRERILEFCPRCYASEEAGSWCSTGGIGYCLNCGSGGMLQIPFWAIECLRESASWVGRRYYPQSEDMELNTELAYLRSQMKDAPGREAIKLEEGLYQVKQDLRKGRSMWIQVKASSVDDALAKAKTKLPYVPKP